MAHEVVLLCSDPECEDNSASIRLLAVLGRMHSPTVHVALTQSAVSIVEAANKEVRLKCVLDHAWDVQMTETAIYKERLLSNEELHSYAGELGGTFADVDFDHLEAKGEFLDRLAQALFTPCAGATVAVVSPSVIAACLELLNIELGEAKLVYVHLKVWAETKRGTVFNSADNWTQAEELLQKPLFLLDIPLDVSVTLQPVPKQRLPPLDSRRPANAEKFEEMLEEQVKRLSAVFAGQVSEAVGRVIEECKPLEPDPSESTASRVAQSLASQHDRILSDLGRLSEALRNVDDFGESKQEVEELNAAFGYVQREMREVEDLCAQMTEALQPRVQALQVLLEQVGTQQTELSRELENAKFYSFTKGFPLVVRSVSRTEDGAHYASIVNRKFYNVYGQVAVFQNDQLMGKLDTVTFSGESQVMLPLFADLAPGTYDVTVLHFCDAREISRRFAFTLRRQWEDCVFCQTIGNTQELERTFVALGHGGSDLFRALTGALRAEDMTRINEFLQILVDETLHTEAEFRSRLAERNFIVRT